MQRYGFVDFIQRLKFYAFHEFNKLAERGDFKFAAAKNTKIYTLSFLTGTIFKAKSYRHVVNLRTSRGELVDDQTTHIFIELPKFTKEFSNLRTKMDKILYIMKYTDELTKEELKQNGLQIPQEEFLKEMIRRLKMANLTPRERADYARAAAAVGSEIGYRESQAEKVKKAIEERKKAIEERKKAVEERKEAVEAKRKAIEDKKEVDVQLKKALESKKKAIEDKKLADAQRKEADIKRRKLEAKRRKLEAKRKESEAKRKEMERQLHEGILNLLKTKTLTDLQIAQAMQVPIEVVEKLKQQL